MPPRESGAGGSTRATPRTLLLVAAALLLVRVITGVWEGLHPPKHPDLVHWRPIDAAVAEAKAAKKPILYEFSAAWCGPCRTMSEDMFEDRANAQFIDRNFVPVKVVDRMREDGHNTDEVDLLEKRFAVKAFPTVVVVPPDGGEPTTIEGYPGQIAFKQRLAESHMKLMMKKSGTITFP
jgi:thiol:disulfide interchange protein